MKTSSGKKNFLGTVKSYLARAFIGAGFLLGVNTATAQLLPSASTNYFTPLATWSFNDNTNWTNDQGRAPVAFANLNSGHLGDAVFVGLAALVLDTNLPAWLQYNVMETNGATNLTVDVGTVMFWFAPGSWSSTSIGGSGPGASGRLLEAGAYTPDSSFGWWSLYVDDAGDNLYFSAQTNDLSSSVTTYFSVPIGWTTNYFHHLALTYCATNTALYLDGDLITNGPPLVIYPGPEALSNGFFIGSDVTGVYQAHGIFNSLATYNAPLDADTISEIYFDEYGWFMFNPENVAMFSLVSATSSPSPLTNAYNIITGIMQPVGSVTPITSTNFWITNAVAGFTNGAMTMTFTIQGGAAGVAYDVFANSVLDFSANTNRAWGWQGQGYHGNIYTLTNLPATTCFLMLGSPRDADLDGLTDAYELLVSKTNPANADSDGDGISDSDEILNGTNPLAGNPGWKLDTDGDGLPDFYETLVGWNFNYAEAPPGLPTYSANPIQ